MAGNVVLRPFFGKCTRIYLSEANDALYFLAHSKQCLWILCGILLLSSVVLPKARAIRSSTNLIPEDDEVGRLQALTRLVL
jgi:hypothetical protein